VVDHNGRLDEVGRSLKLIRWRQTRDGWEAEYAAGFLVARDATGWVLDTGAAEVVCPADQWSIYRS